MKVKSTTNFAGEICMAAGEVRDIPENVAAPLLECGYLEAVDGGGSGPDPGAAANGKTITGHLDAAQLKKMKRADLNALAADMGIADPGSYKNAGELAEAISKIQVGAPAGGSTEYGTV